MASIGLKIESFFERMRKYMALVSSVPFPTDTEEGRSKERYRLIALSGITGVIARIITSMIGIVSVPLTVNYLGKEQFGLWMVVSSLVVWMQLADLGISNGLANALAEANGKDDKLSASYYITSCLVASFCVALFCLFPIILLSLYFPWAQLLKITNPDLEPLVSQCFLVVGLLFVINLPLAIVGRVFVAYQLGYISNIAQVVSSLLALVGLLLAMIFKMDMLWLIFLVSFAPLGCNVLCWYVLRRVFPWYRLDFRGLSQSAVKRVARSSVPMFLFQIGALLVNQLVNVILARVGSLNMVADYNIVQKLYLALFTLGVSLSSPFYPAIREAYERKDIKWLKKSVYRALLARLCVMLIPALILLFAGDKLLVLWIGKPLEVPFGAGGWLIFVICIIFATISSMFSDILTSLDYIWSQIFMVFLSAFVVISTIFVLLPKIGISSVFLAMMISTVYPITWSWRKIQLKFQGTI